MAWVLPVGAQFYAHGVDDQFPQSPTSPPQNKRTLVDSHWRPICSPPWRIHRHPQARLKILPLLRLLVGRLIRSHFVTVCFLFIPPIVNRHSFVYCIGIVFRHPTFVHFQKLYSGSKHRSLGWMPSNKGVLIFCGIPQCWCPVLVSFQERVFFSLPPHSPTAQRYYFFSRNANFFRFFLSPFNKVFASLTALSLLRKISL